MVCMVGLANNAPGSKHATVDRFREAGIASGYKFRVSDCRTNGTETRFMVSNQGIAPIYRDAYFAIGDTQSEVSLRGLLPGKGMEIVIPVGLSNSDDLQIISPYILPAQKIEFETGVFTQVDEITVPCNESKKQLRDGQLVIIHNNIIYSLLGQPIK